MTTINDAEAPFPLVRLKRFVEADDKWVVHSKMVVSADTNSHEKKSKFNIEACSRRNDEDLVALIATPQGFESWALAEGAWEASDADDATRLFEELEKCFQGAALQHWREIMSRQARSSTSKSWSLFKSCMAEFVVKKVMRKDDCYQFQIDCMWARTMPTDSVQHHFSQCWDCLLLTNSMLKWLLDEKQIITLCNITAALDFERQQ